jgi:hypothetical protein
MEDLPRPQGLISILGLSWQPVALMACWVKPQHALLIGTADSFKSTTGEPVVARIARVSGIEQSLLVRQEVPADGEVKIYAAVKDFLRSTGLSPKQVVVDATGGKKSMCVAAGLAGFLRGCPLVYVDYAEYVGERRIPMAGTEYPRLLANPLEELGDLEHEQIRVAFNAGTYREAESRAHELADRLYANREALVLERMAKAYGCWEAFRFGEALSSLESVCRDVQRFAARADRAWAPGLADRLVDQLSVLRRLAEFEAAHKAKLEGRALEDHLPMVTNQLAAARRARMRGQVSQALMLYYSTVERYTDSHLKARYGLDDEHPDYDSLGDSVDMGKYHEVGRRLVGKPYQERTLDGPIDFTKGLQLLSALWLERVPPTCLGGLSGLQAKRNKCEFEHGIFPPRIEAGELDRFESAVLDLVGAAIGGTENLEAELARYVFPILDAP